MPTGAAPLQAPYNYLPIGFQLGPVDGTDPISMSDVTTLLINPTNVARTYSYLPPHGRTIAAGGSLVLDGDILADLGALRYNRKLIGLKNDVQRGYLHVFRNFRHLVSANVLAAQAIAIGDMVYLSGGNLVPASSLAWNTDLATTQADFANVFLGIAVEAKGVTSGNQKLLVDVSPNSHYFYPCASQTHEIGDTFGPDKDTGNAILKGTLEKAVAASSIARCVQRNPSAATKVVVRFQSSLWGFNAAGSQ